MKLKLFLFAMIVVYIQPLHAQDAFKLNLVMNKSIFIKGEPVEVGVSIVNVSNNLIQEKYLGSLDMKLINDSGVELPRNGGADFYGGPIKHTLAPNEEDYFVEQLNDYFGYLSNGSIIFFQYFPPGNYTLQVIFQPQNTCFNEVTSQTVFQVVEPQGQDLITFNKLQEFLKQESQNPLDKKNLNLVAKELRNLYESYPNSPYSLHILDMLDAMYSVALGELDMAIWAQTELVEKYSWSIHVTWLLESFLNRRINAADQVEYVKKLISKNKGRLAEKIYEQKLQQLEKN